jgi:hypothetical protein
VLYLWVDMHLAVFVLYGLLVHLFDIGKALFVAEGLDCIEEHTRRMLIIVAKAFVL